MDALIVCSVVAGIGLFMGLAALVLAAEHQADIPALRDEVDRLRSVVDRMTEAQVARKPSQRPVEPLTRPIGLPVSERTDTEPVAAVIDNGLRKLSGATASGYGRHRAP